MEELFSNPYAGLLGQDEERIAQQAKMQGLLGLASSLFEAGAPSPVRQGIGQALGRGLQAYQQGAQGTFDQALKSMLVRQQMSESQEKRKQQEAQRTALQNFVSTLPEDQRTLAMAFPEQFATQRFREASGVVGEFQDAVRGGFVPEGTTLAQYIEMKRPPGTTVKNIIGGSELTPGQKKVDEKFAEDFVAWSSGGGQDMAAQIAQLKPVISALEEGKPITGLQVAVQPDLLLAMTNPTALQSREQVEEVVQRNLRVILGAQFTEKEGERLIARAFNPKLPPQENAKRLRRLFLQMSTAAEQKQAMGDYFQENGTLRGYKGKMPSVQDFYNAMEGSAPTFSGDSAQSLQDQARRELERRKGSR